jgi:hypothetical protein
MLVYVFEIVYFLLYIMIWVWLMTVYHKNDSWVQARVCYTHPVDECSSMTQTGSCETIHH